MVKSIIKKAGFFCAALAAATTTMFSPALSSGVHHEKGYTPSPLEVYLIETFAREQIDGFVSFGSSTLFENPKIYYFTSGAFAAAVKQDLAATRKNYSDAWMLVKGNIKSISSNGSKYVIGVSSPSYQLNLEMKQDAVKPVPAFKAGQREGFYCRIKGIEAKQAYLTNCVTQDEFTEEKTTEIEKGIKDFLSGASNDDANMPTYAMLAYMALVSARLLPHNSVCRANAEDVTSTDAEYRLCEQEISHLWQNSSETPKFDSTMDETTRLLSDSGVDVSLIEKAAIGLLD